MKSKKPLDKILPNVLKSKSVRKFRELTRRKPKGNSQMSKVKNITKKAEQIFAFAILAGMALAYLNENAGEPAVAVIAGALMLVYTGKTLIGTK